MLESELMGKSFRKSDHRKALAPKLLARSEGSIEFKHQNVSGVLVELGLPYIEGYKPAGNYQKTLLPQAIHDYLDLHPSFFHGLSDGPILSPREVPAIHAGSDRRLM